MVFRADQGNGQEVKLPCGQCIGCRVQKAKEWALRCVHEASLHEENCFITLTYDDEHLPSPPSVNVGHFQKFIKRLRKRIAPKRIRYFHCGEYGERLRRPHYHALLFGYDFADRQDAGDGVFVSEILENVWGKGYCTVGDVTFQSCRYVASYVTKKITGDKRWSHYLTVEPHTGEIQSIEPEYVTMSRRPGIGKGWLEKYGSDVYPDGYVVHDGVKHKPPRFYDEEYAKHAQEVVDAIRKERRSKVDPDEQTDARLLARETVAKAAFRLRKRKIEQ